VREKLIYFAEERFDGKLEELKVWRRQIMLWEGMDFIRRGGALRFRCGFSHDDAIQWK